MKKTFLWIVFLGVLTLALAACNVPQAPTATQASSVSTPKPVENTPAAQPTSTTGALDLPSVLNLHSGLDAADSYRTTFKMEVVGKNEADEDVDETFEINQEINRSQNANRVTWKNSESSDMPEFTIIYLNGQAFMDTSSSSDQAGCFVYPGEDAQSELSNMTPSAFVGDIAPENLVAQGETVNGMVTNHYSVKKADLIFTGEVTSASGDIWVTQDGKYVIKYVYRAEGKFDAMSQGTPVTGVMTMTFDLTDINKVAEITVPQACLDQLNALSDLPVMADATDMSSMSGIVSYSTASEPAAVKDFYMTKGAAQGWVVSDDNSMEGYISFNITKDGQKYNVIISAGGSGGSTVILMLEQ